MIDGQLVHRKERLLRNVHKPAVKFVFEGPTVNTREASRGDDHVVIFVITLITTVYVVDIEVKIEV